jgi:uncharacterized membrane protein
MSRKRLSKPTHTPTVPQDAALVETRVSWSGPLPPPSTLREFDSVVENGAARIFEAWETETTHRRNIENYELNTFRWNSLLGRIFSFIFVISSLLLAGFMAYIGAPWPAMLLGGATMASVVWAFNKVSKSETG